MERNGARSDHLLISDVGFLMSDVGYQIADVRCKIYGIRSFMSGLIEKQVHPKSEIRNQKSDIRNHTSAIYHHLFAIPIRHPVQVSNHHTGSNTTKDCRHITDGADDGFFGVGFFGFDDTTLISSFRTKYHF